MLLEQRGIPSVAVVTAEFLNLAEATAVSLGYPDLKIVVLPYPFQPLPREDAIKIAEDKFDEIVRALTER